MTLLAEPPDPADVTTGFVPPDAADLAAERGAVAADLGARYRVESFIARGGFASVWGAFDAVEGRGVAVKRVRPAAGRARDFFRELRAMFALDHPNVVRIVNFLEAGPARYLILELCGGGSLRAAVSAARRGRGPMPDAAGVVRQLAAGAAAAHKLGLTHRDVKPENVVFADDRATAKLADFGLASLLDGGGGGALKSLTGSPAYMAPEQFCGTFGPASDVYSLGVVAFELLTGDVPFLGGATELAYQHLRTTPTFPTLLPPWNTLLPAMLAKEPADRPTAGEVAAALGTPRAAATERVLDRPAEQVVESGGDFLFAGPDGFTHAAGFVPLPGLTAVQRKPGGAWCVAGPDVIEWEPGSAPLRLGELPRGCGSPVVFEADGRVLAAWVQSGAVVVHDVVGARREWATAVPGGGLRPKLARLPDGTFACTDFDGGPGVRFLSAGGGAVGRVPLPGICWQLVPWANGGCAARLLTGGGFHAFRVSPRGARPLPGGGGVCALGTDSAGRAAVGAWADGTVKLWQPGRSVKTAAVAPCGAVRGAATDGRTAAVLWAGPRVSIVEPS